MKYYSKNYLEYRIAYVRHLLESMPHGYAGKYKGIPVVYVTYDPRNPTVSWKSKRRYRADSPRGAVYLEEIRRYTKLNLEYRDLLNVWNSYYVCMPRKIVYPLRKKRADIFGKEYFDRAVSGGNQMNNPNPIEYNGNVYRSKNEVITAQLLDSLGLMYKTDVLLEFVQFTRTYCDFLIYIPEIDKVIILEVDGAIDNSSYESKSYKTTAKMIMSGLVEGKDFIVVRIADKRNISVDQIMDLLWGAVEASIRDIIVY